MVINLIFGMLAMFHLAYLGVMFDQQETQVSYFLLRHLYVASPGLTPLKKGKL